MGRAWALLAMMMNENVEDDDGKGAVFTGAVEVGAAAGAAGVSFLLVSFYFF